MVDTARHPSRRTILKAGLWAAPAVAVVNLTSVSAAHASVTSLCYPSHGILVYSITTAGTQAYYAFKFGTGTGAAPFVDVEQNGNDVPFLNGIYGTFIGSSSRGTAAQQAVWSSLKTIIDVRLYSSGPVVGYAFYGPLTYLGGTLVAAYTYNGHQYTLVTSSGSGPFIFTSC